MRKTAEFFIGLKQGFALLGNNYCISNDGDELYTSLLFYSVKLRCYMAVDIHENKVDEEYAAEFSVYLSAVDSKLKTEDDNSTIGLILSDNSAEYVLKSKDIYSFMHNLPKAFEKVLPASETILSRIK